MRRELVVLLMLIVVGAVSGLAQDTDRSMQAYRDRFREAPPETRLQTLRSAGTALLAVTMLDYPRSVTGAARAALNVVSQ